jgi:hypothetical protein
MGRVIIRQNPDIVQQNLERSKMFLNLSTTEKLNELFALIDLSVKLNGGKPLKMPQGKGLVLRKIKKNDN